MLAFAVDVQVGIPRFWTAVGIVATTVASLWLFEPLPGVTLRPSWITLIAGIGGIALAFVVGMPSMVRTRFATPTIGREWMIGELGEVVEAVDPDGVVSVGSARWRARTNRATPVAAGESGARRRHRRRHAGGRAAGRAPPATTASGGRRPDDWRFFGRREPSVNSGRDPLPTPRAASYGDPREGRDLDLASSRERAASGAGTDFYPPMHTERKHERLARERRAKSVCASCPVRVRVPRARHRRRRALRHLGRPEPGRAPPAPRIGLIRFCAARALAVRHPERRPAGGCRRCARRSRRRVTPRASSSASSGTACLRVIPAASRNSPTVKPRRVLGQQAGRQPAGGGDGVGVEPQPVALDEHAPAGQLAQLGPVDAVRCRWRHPAGGQRGHDRMVGQRVGPAGPPGVGAVDDDAVERGEHGPLALVERRPARGRAVRRRRDVRPVDGRGGRDERRRSATHRPTVGARRSPVSSSSSSTSTQPRSATTRSTERSGRARDAGSTGATSSTSPPPTVSSRPVSRSTNRSPGSSGRAAGRCSRTAPGLARRQRLRAEHPQAHGVLARADVGEVGAAPGHVVVERWPARSARRRRAPSSASGRWRRRRRPGPASLCSTPARLSATRWPGPMAATTVPDRLDRRAPSPAGRRARRRRGRRSPSTPSVSVPVTTVPLPLRREHAVDPQPGPAAVARRRRRAGELGERGGELVDADARSARRPARSARRRGTCRRGGRRPRGRPARRGRRRRARRPW